MFSPKKYYTCMRIVLQFLTNYSSNNRKLNGQRFIFYSQSCQMHLRGI